MYEHRIFTIHPNEVVTFIRNMKTESILRYGCVLNKNGFNQFIYEQAHMQWVKKNWPSIPYLSFLFVISILSDTITSQSRKQRIG